MTTMTKKFKVSYIANCGGYSQTIYAAWYQLFDTEAKAVAFIEEENQKNAKLYFETNQKKGHYVVPITYNPKHTEFCIQEVFVLPESQATAWLREHGNKFEALPLTEISQGWKIAEWGGGPINFHAPTLPVDAWSHQPDELGKFEIRFADDSRCECQLLNVKNPQI